MAPPPKIGIGILNLEFRCRATSLLRKNSVLPGKNTIFEDRKNLKRYILGGHHIYIYNDNSNFENKTKIHKYILKKIPQG